ncbi:Beta-galactosidase [Kordia antarctica]|uniref:Beta-galactosidase n=1 Tax=Kordia antarctica TaxID=1218801 RepID=A0A7L4ZTT8_9FLAO|nr:glycoside hydrolase family 2 TIM barrel-domain containing protein [Kordia antarctica]QHI39266.1 Beta-galactosidase [Kordia antarctica]
MKYLKGIGLLIVAALAFQSCKDAAVKENLGINENWKFSKVDESKDLEGQIHALSFDDSAWETVHLPHTANIEPLTVNNQWQGICWYRKRIDIPKSDSDKKIFLEFEAAMNYSKIWINGIEVTEHQGGYLPVVMDISNYVKAGDENIIAVRLDNTDNLVTGPKPLKRLDFNMYGGLYRKANVITKEKIYISHAVLANKVAGGGIFITYPKVSEEESVVNVKTHIINEYKDLKSIELVQTIFRNGEVVEKTTSSNIEIEAEKDIELTKQFAIVNAHLWSPKHPNLYSLETKVLQDGKVIDEQTTRFGIREFTFDDAHQLHINGKKTFLRGVNRHQEYPHIGYALSDNAQYRDAKKIKDAGFDYIRLSHYPQSPAFMDACDELGLVVMDVIMGWQYYNDTDNFRNYCYNSATNLVRRDRNHPCVLGWEVSLNETKTMPIYFMEELHTIAHAEYPGENVYSAGWKDDVYDIYLEARQHRILRPHPYKEKPITVSEYGDWEYYSKNAGLNQDKLPNDLRLELSSRQARGFGEKAMLNQAYNVQEAHNDNLNMRAFSDSYWVMYDYNRGYHDNIERSGLMDIFRLPKFAYYFYQSQRDIDDAAILELATYWNEKSPTDITVYSNTDEVELYLNDELIGKQQPDSGANTENLKHPPFTFKLNTFKAGTLKAIGFVDGKKVAEDTVITPQKPTELKVWLDESDKVPTAGQNDVLFLYVAAIDANGTVHPDFSETITWNINGNVKVMNVGAIKAEAGIATAVIQIGNTKETIQVAASSKELKGNFEFEIE